MWNCLFSGKILGAGQHKLQKSIVVRDPLREFLCYGTWFGQIWFCWQMPTWKQIMYYWNYSSKSYKNALIYAQMNPTFKSKYVVTWHFSWRGRKGLSPTKRSRRSYNIRLNWKIIQYIGLFSKIFFKFKASKLQY